MAEGVRAVAIEGIRNRNSELSDDDVMLEFIRLVHGQVVADQVRNLQDALQRKGMFNVIATMSGWKVDIIIKKDRPFSDSEFERRQQVDVQGISTWVVSLEDAVLSKLEWCEQSGSDRQLATLLAWSR